MIIFWRTLVLVSMLMTVVLAQDQELNVEAGSTVNLQCRPSSSRPDIPTTYQWLNPRGEIIPGSGPNTVILNFSENDEGSYTCRATQLIDGQVAMSSKAVNVRIRSGRRPVADFKVDVPGTYDAFASGIIFLLCKTTLVETSNLKFQWIPPANTGINPTLVSTFFKNKATMSDSGSYTCRVTRTTDGVWTEATTFVTVQPVPIKIDSEGAQVIGGSLILNCKVDTEKTARKLFVQFKYEWLNPRNEVITRDQTLRLPIRDYSDFGTYTCRITAEGTEPRYVQEQRVEIKSAGRTSSTTYNVNFATNPTVVRFLQPFTFTCQVDPPLRDARYRIIFNNQEISSSPSYSIPRVDKEHIGVYECTVEGTDPGTGQRVNMKSTYTIEQQFKTEFKIDMMPVPGPQITARVGDKRELHCEISISDNVTGRDVVWFFNDIELRGDALSRYNVQVLPRMYVSIAVLKSIQQRNQGRYQCKVKGVVKEAFLIVMSRARNMEVNPASERRKVGDMMGMEFHCRISGYNNKNRDLIWTFKSSLTGETGPIDNRWKRNDDPSADETSFISLDRGLIEITDDGTYICTEPATADTARGVLTVTSEMRIVITPPRIKVRAGSTATVQCFAESAGRSMDYPDIDVGMGGRSGMNPERVSKQKLESGKIQLQYREVTMNDNGTEFICRKGGQTVRSLLLVDPVCTSGLRLCKNGVCINSAKFCDGRIDCADGSDEDLKYCRSCDPLTKRCERHGGREPSTPYFQVHWTCDGEDDCGNGFDEAGCFGNVLTCGGLNYQCNDGFKRIPKAFVCDSDKDCTNGDDEDRCIAPMILSENTDSYGRSIKRGETFTMKCQARGYPLPKIIWRYNWGCLTEDSRMVVTESYQDCSSTISLLTISNFQPGDDGIYNCEALTGGKRAWSKDYRVYMEFKN